MKDENVIAVEYIYVASDYSTAKTFAVALRSMIGLLASMGHDMPEKISLEVEQGSNEVKMRTSAPCYDMFDKLTSIIESSLDELKDM
jgi:hypothetical protein